MRQRDTIFPARFITADLSPEIYFHGKAGRKLSRVARFLLIAAWDPSGSAYSFCAFRVYFAAHIGHALFGDVLFGYVALRKRLFRCALANNKRVAFLDACHTNIVLGVGKNETFRRG